MAIFVAYGAWGQSQPLANDTEQSAPVKEKGGNVPDKQNAPKDSKGIVPQTPTSREPHAAAQAKPTATNTQGTSQNSEKSWWDKITADPNVEFNGLLVLFTLVLAITSIRQGTLAREEFLATHRPRIILREAYTAPDMGHAITVMFNVENTGSSEARVIDSKFAIFFAPMDGTKRQVQFSGEMQPGEVDNTIPIGQRIQAGAFYEASCASPTTHWNKEWGRWADKDASGRRTRIQATGFGAGCVYFYGKISYRDALGVARNMAFYRVLDFDSYRFVPFRDPQLEYSDERP